MAWKKGETVVLLALRSRQHRHSVEHGLLHHHQQSRRQKEDGVGECAVVRIVLLVGDCRHQLHALLLGEARRRIPLNLYLPDFVQHHEVAAHHQILVVEEATHVGVNRQGGGLHPSQPLAEIFRKIDDAVHFPLLEKPFGFRHRGAPVGNLQLTRRVHLTDVAAAFGTVGIIDYRNRNVLQHTVFVHQVVKQRVAQRPDGEDDEHTAIVDNQLPLVAADSPEVLQPLLDKGRYSVELVHSSLFFRVIHIDVGIFQS